MGDLNNVRKLDLAATGLRAFGVLLGNGDGTFQPPVTISEFGSGDPITADFKTTAFSMSQ